MPFDSTARQLLRRGFSLIELLVVLAVISILGTLVISVTGKLNKATDKAQSISNLRQVGIAMLSYTNDNDGFLPGPLWVGMHTYAKSTDPKLLGTLLAPYLGVTVPEKRGEIAQVPALICPRWAALTTDMEAKAWAMQGRIVLNDGRTVSSPFGRTEKDNTDSKPVNMEDLHLPGRIGAMRHNDGAKSGVDKPVFDTFRLKLFLDAHVEEIPID